MPFEFVLFLLQRDFLPALGVGDLAIVPTSISQASLSGVMSTRMKLMILRVISNLAIL